MKSLVLVVLLAAAATAAVVSNEMLEVVEVPERVEGDEVADVDVNEMPTVIVSDVDELTEATELTDEDELIDKTATRRNLILGCVGPSDRLVFHAAVGGSAVENHYHIRDIRISTNRPITAIHVIKVGSSQGAAPSIVNGGIGHNWVTIRIRSTVNQGYNYIIKIWVTSN